MPQTKRAKSKNSHYSLILQGYTNPCSGKVQFRNFRTILNIDNSSIIVTGKLTSKLKNKSSSTTTWGKQYGIFKASQVVNVDLCQPGFSATKTVTWKCHVDKYTVGRYDIILLLTTLVIDIKFSDHVIISGDRPYIKGAFCIWLT